MFRLNLGCGHNREAGFLNVDISPQCEPDLVCDLDATPWPWDDSSVAEVLFNHSLEHLGETSRQFLAIFKELYRVCRHQARIEIHVPHPRHDDFINDPTHVRAITPALLALFDREMVDRWQEGKFSNTPLAQILDVDFHLERIDTILDEPYATLLANGSLAEPDIRDMLRENNNIAKEYHFTLIVRKPGR